MSVLESHPIADLFPMMSDDESAALVSSMRAHGFDRNHPIILLDGKILDGRNRYRASREAGVEYVARELSSSDGNPWDFVWRENATRRQLEAGRLGAIALDFARGSEAYQAERAEELAKVNAARATAIAASMAGNQNAKTDRVSRDTPSVLAIADESNAVVPSAKAPPPNATRSRPSLGSPLPLPRAFWQFMPSPLSSSSASSAAKSPQARRSERSSSKQSARLLRRSAPTRS